MKAEKKCICNTEIKKLENLHFQRRNRVLSVNKDSGRVIISEDDFVVAEFEANYCQICGKRLIEIED